jgi:acyl-coenzyme A synthetase/AMP-(fatty) acid ligase
VPAIVSIIDSLPKTSNGKIDKPELRRISVADKGAA